MFWFSLLGRARFAAELNCFLAHKRTNQLGSGVTRIRNEHLDHACGVINDRVKGSLKVTRAFGASFLKQFLCFTHRPTDMFFPSDEKRGENGDSKVGKSDGLRFIFFDGSDYPFFLIYFIVLIN
ncbi:phosphatase 2C family protein [Striga asiatica]|uniref:Phosphatase 2C family protein n=1 Tax=Striga asiatica TaxID=4170 RepID=A0A5A7QSJ5_STRAF|nr:phosphatase 2C family protein [Striga asiatica]